jgi:hypothetical protein
VLKVAKSEHASTFGILDDPAGGCVAEPEAAALVTRESLSADPDRVDIGSLHPSMRPDRGVGQLASLAKVDDVLTRGVQELGSLSRR